MDRRTFGIISASIVILALTFASIFNWFQGLGGTGAHAEVYDELFTLYWGLGTVIGMGVYIYFLWLLTTESDGSGDDMRIGQRPEERGDNRVAWGITIVIALFLLVLSDVTFDSIDFFEKHEEHTTDDSFTVEITGYQYYWDYQYPNGISYTSASGEPLRVPVDVPVVFEVTSGDVFHSYALPEHRIKVDAIPGRVNTGWIQAEETGTYPVRCFELCGDEHTIMIGVLEVMEKDDFDMWYSGGVA
ncbi:MAG: cytochrome c oxidase subunit II [Candidatus Thalassarchaeum sp.]|jgi:cytochrome c oxidase subunit 2|nr:cytochrome c oxidase subunit II [Candidatus Thalassarchaeum sp.]MDP6920418.1 cytochrome c oxidase subunit II [Candidatus Thalassarchaeum sp.]|tara:strand:- start:236 stop:970 length:735 start_codon:yes stop_codon:yes gene_type:complete